MLLLCECASRWSGFAFEFIKLLQFGTLWYNGRSIKCKQIALCCCRQFVLAMKNEYFEMCIYCHLLQLWSQL